jgi:flagellar protein FlaJ
MKLFKASKDKRKPKVFEAHGEESHSTLYHFAYNLLGRQLERVFPLFNGLKPVLQQSGLRATFKAYVSLIWFSFILSTILSFVVFVTLSILFPQLIGMIPIVQNFLRFPYFILLSLILSLAVGCLTFFIVYSFPTYKRMTRKERLEENLVYTSSYMTVLACAGVPPERILRSTAMKDPKFLLSNEIKSIVGKIDLLGYDTLSALNSEIERSPSSLYSNMLRGFAATIRTGGNVKKYFLNTTRQLMQRRSMRLQQFLDSLGIVAEIYVIMLIAFPLLLVIMLAVMASVGGTIWGVDVFYLMYFLTFALIPLCGLMFLVLIEMIQPKG